MRMKTKTIKYQIEGGIRSIREFKQGGVTIAKDMVGYILDITSNGSYIVQFGNYAIVEMHTDDMIPFKHQGKMIVDMLHTYPAHHNVTNWVKKIQKG